MNDHLTITAVLIQSYCIKTSWHFTCNKRSRLL